MIIPPFCQIVSAIHNCRVIEKMPGVPEEENDNDVEDASGGARVLPVEHRVAIGNGGCTVDNPTAL